MPAVDLEAGAPTPLLDVEKALAMMGDAEAVREILVMAAGTLTDELAQIEACLRAGDTVAAGRVLHTIKGSLPIFAIDPLVDSVTVAERATKMGPVTGELVPQIRSVTVQLQHLIQEIKYFVANPGAGIE